MLNPQLTRKEAIIQIAQRFSAADLYYGHGTDNADDEAFQLVLVRVGLEDEAFRATFDQRLTAPQCEQLEQDIQVRITQRLPLPYITHTAFLGGLRFYVDPRVIIPRSPIAQLIGEGFFPWLDLSTTSSPCLLDMCTGSGCLAILMAVEIENSQVDAVDISADALAVAKQNVQAHGLQDRVHLYASDLFEQLPQKKYEVIVCNPPYVDDQDFNSMPLEYTHEPAVALHAEDQGLALVLRLLKAARHYLSETGVLIVEVGNSEEALVARLPQLPFIWLEFARGGQGVFLLTARDLDAF